MGTAPDDRQTPDALTPDEITDTLVRMLRQVGYSHRDALGHVARISGYFMKVTMDAGNDRWRLCEQVLDLALTRLVSHDPSTDDHTGDEHADGTGR